MKRAHWQAALATASVAGILMACAADDALLAPGTASYAKTGAGAGALDFTPLASSAACTSGGDAMQPLVLAAGYTQAIVASEPDFADAIDMNTVNENGIDAGRYLYRAHELGSNGAVSVTDLRTGTSRTIVQRIDLESLDPTVWTPWGTLLIAEETNSARLRDPQHPDAVGGLVYEIAFVPGDPTTMQSITARPAIGAKSHEGMRFDPQGNLYSISERTPGYIFRFVPDRRGDLSSGQSYVLKVTQSEGDRVGGAEWIPVDRAAVQIDASAEGDRVGATGYGRPEDVELATSTGNNRGGANVLYVAITSEHRVLAIDLREPAGGRTHATAHVTEYVARGLNTTDEFTMPDNLALDRGGNLYITEDPGGSYSSGKRIGDDIWVATPGQDQHAAARSVSRFATLTDCDAEPTGVYVDMLSDRVFVNVQHRGGDRLDKAMAISRAR